VELYLNSLNTLSWRSAQLKQRDHFTFTCRVGYRLLDRRRNEDILEELKLDPEEPG